MEWKHDGRSASPTARPHPGCTAIGGTAAGPRLWPWFEASPLAKHLPMRSWGEIESDSISSDNTLGSSPTVHLAPRTLWTCQCVGLSFSGLSRGPVSILCQQLHRLRCQKLPAQQVFPRSTTAASARWNVVIGTGPSGLHLVLCQDRQDPKCFPSKDVVALHEIVRDSRVVGVRVLPNGCFELRLRVLTNSSSR
jgi:hypothetical protein